MNVKKMIAMFAVVALIGSTTALGQETADAVGTASVVWNPDETDQLVEGHTVYEKIEFVNGSRDAAAIAVLVQEKNQPEQVLWFDDSFLHYKQAQVKPKCDGTVWAVPNGAPLLSPSDYTAQETYKIDDVEHSKTWRVTRYRANMDVTGEIVEAQAWAVEVDCEAPATPFKANGTGDAGDDGVNQELTSRPGSAAPDVISLDYNAVLWFWMGDFDYNVCCGVGVGLHDGPQKAHGAGGVNQADSTTEGNSHPYNPVDPNAADTHNHTTTYIDLYYEEDVKTLNEGPQTFDNLEDVCWHDHDGDGYCEGAWTADHADEDGDNDINTSP